MLVTLFEIFNELNFDPKFKIIILKRLENTFFFSFLMYDDKKFFKSGTTIISACTETAFGADAPKFPDEV